MPVIEFYKPDILVESLKIFEDELNALGFSKTYNFYYLTNNGAVLHDAFKSDEYRDYMLVAKQ